MPIITSILLTLVVLAQSAALVVCPAGTYTVTTPASTTITRTATSITFSWEATPGPAPAPYQRHHLHLPPIQVRKSPISRQFRSLA